jgi:hypothetical protein
MAPLKNRQPLKNRYGTGRASVTLILFSLSVNAKFGGKYPQFLKILLTKICVNNWPIS